MSAARMQTRWGWVALGSLLAWLRWPSWLWIAGALGALGLGWAVGRWRGRAPLALTLLAGAAAAVAGVGVETLHRITQEWPTYWSRQEAQAGEALQQRIEALIARGDAAVADVAASSGTVLPTLEDLEDARGRGGLSALAVYDLSGVPLLWTGVHHGEVPEAVRTDFRSYLYHETPLFGYLYFTLPSPGGQTVVVGAALLRAELPATLAAGEHESFASRFREGTGEEIRISTGERVQGPAVWDFRWEERTLFSMQVVRPAQAERYRSTQGRWARRVLALALAAWLVLLRLSPLSWRVPAVALTVGALALLLPVERLFGVLPFFSPADYLLPGLPASLGRVMLVVGALAIWLGLVSPPSRRGGPLVTALATAVGLPLLIGWLAAGASTSILAGPEARWIVYTLVLATAAAIVAVQALSLGRPRRGDHGLRMGWLVLALGVAVGAALLLGRRVQAGLPVAPLWAAGWAAPAALAAWALGSRPGLLRSAVTVVAGALLALSAVVPVAWGQRTQARMRSVGDELTRLGSASDPYVEFLLERAGEEMRRLQDEVERPIELLYETWQASGLADVEIPLWLTLWAPDNLPREVLPIGMGTDTPDLSAADLDQARASGQSAIRRVDRPDLLYLGIYPLGDGAVGSVAIPPRRELVGTSPLGPLFSGVERTRDSPLSLVPVEYEGAADGEARLDWTAADGGLTAERVVAFPDGAYRARYRLDLSGTWLALVRGTLLFAGGVALVGLLFAAGRAVELRPQGGYGIAWSGVLTSFRGRVTLGLFGFFLLSTVVIGILALRTLARAADRTAEALATRVAEEAAQSFPGPGRDLGPLAAQVGADLLLYRDGALLSGAVVELVELGIYPGWLPMDVHQALSGGQALTASAPGQVGRWHYVMAYRSLGDGRVLASPASLQVGATALRRRETFEVLGFILLLGGAFSLGLALLVGRTLTRPIETLRVASERVGAGNLEVRLPEEREDEFGAVFLAFNRMVARLGTTRDALTRTTRRTQAIVEEAATGVIALDPEGQVVLVNPRAEAILAADLVPGEVLPRSAGERAHAFAAWVDRFFEDGLPEGTVEFEFGERRVRARGRRISRAEPLGGAVFSLADVTDEMRAERVLAWGEMARQIAHEVKNPLTPIKLSVQHIQRAWDDGVNDYGTVLQRNVGAILGEIDRLAEIAGSFSRFSAPEGEGEGAPLERVEVGPVVADLLALYAAPEDGVRFEADIAAGLPPVRAREAQLKEVLVNLLENARTAVGERGTVRVQAEARAGLIEVCVVDDGVGIPAADLARVFEPRFSTRSRGTGLGLAIVRRLVESWGGSVSAESASGEGTVVRILLSPWLAGAETGGAGAETRA